MRLDYLIPVQTVSEANKREHWAPAYRRHMAQLDTAYLHTLHALNGMRFTLPISIVLTRVGKKRMDPDNSAGATKYVQDGIARALGYDDGDEGLDWHYEQERGEAGVKVSISGRVER